ncbi:MAG: hypothetical protein IPN76_06840 [Saprospiraceae bacterium]|nr:hypothetical protein [Saprospiraceae bacterium]
MEQKAINGQGFDAPTGNTFSGLPDPNSSFKSTGGQTIQYFFTGNANSSNPQHFTYGGTAFQNVNGNELTIANAACTSVTPCSPPCDETTNQLLKQTFYGNRQERNTKKAALATMTNQQQIEAEKKAIQNLESLMEQYASLVVQNYALDTMGLEIETDSILTWLEHSESYSSDLERLNHYFFNSDLDEFDDLWEEVPTKHGLSGDNLGEFNELELVYELVRPTVELEEGNLSNLSEPVIDSLMFWKSWCSEPGFLVKSLLRWNGIETSQDCESPQRVAERQSIKEGKSLFTSRNLDYLFIPTQQRSLDCFFQDHLQIDFSIALCNLRGQVCFIKTTFFLEM